MQEPITIAGVLVEIPILYGEGYTLNAQEGQAVHQFWRDKLRNNLTTPIKKMQDQGASEDDIRSFVEDYANCHPLGVRNGGGQRDPVMVEAIHIAKTRLLKFRADAGKKGKVNGTNLLKASRKLIATDADIIKEAQRRVKTTSAIAARDLTSLVAEL